MKAKSKVKQLKLRFDKRGENSTRASSLLSKSKEEWTKLFEQEVKREKEKKNPKMPSAAKRASRRYKSKRLTWGQALKKANKINKKKKAR
ncbi:MAG: hypothetical protein LBG80_19115 [Bacteroidales bacterium]|jgi:hypothetical protein|nr:hypothetical protein [Bacteroidales bacterium]